MRLQYLVIAGAALILAACAARPTAPVVTAPAYKAAPSRAAPPPAAPFAPPSPRLVPIPPPAVTPLAFASLPGWATDDHLAALQAFTASCPAQKDPALIAACGRALALSHPGEAEAQRFFETNFRLEPATGAGLLTGYFTPIYEARDHSEGEFTAPVRPRPADLPSRASGVPYLDRAEIERRRSRDALAWMRPEDLFFLQIQGSGILVLPSGARMRAVYDGANGQPFLGIAGPMRDRGLLPGDDASGDAVHQWLADHRGPAADAMMDLDRRYVFFRLQPDDGQTPVGAAGAHLATGRALAVDPAWHAMGDLLWIDAEAPTLAGAFPVYQRLAVALDTGSAIKGDSRADLYLGEGPAAGVEAGRVRHILRLYRLAPIDPAGS